MIGKTLTRTFSAGGHDVQVENSRGLADQGRSGGNPRAHCAPGRRRLR
ncbi:hypothetical protein ACWY4P_45115 [Streptomyces sp. LZ34]